METNKINLSVLFTTMVIFMIIAMVQCSTAQDLILESESYSVDGHKINSPASLVIKRDGIITIKAGDLVVSEPYQRVDMEKLGDGTFSWDVVLEDNSIIESIFFNSQVSYIKFKQGKEYHLNGLVRLKGKAKKEFCLNNTTEIRN